MKRAGFLTAVAVAAVGTLVSADAADAAVRYVKSPSRNQNKEEDATVRSGNVRRSGNVGNVRSSSRSGRQPSSSSRRVTNNTPTVTRTSPTSSSTRRSSSSADSRRTSSSNRRSSSSPTTRSTSTVSRTPRSNSTTRTVQTPTSGRTRHGTRTTSTAGSVRPGSGNVTYSYVSRRGPVTTHLGKRKEPLADGTKGAIAYRRLADPDDEHKCHRWRHHRRRRRRRPHCEPPIYIVRRVEPLWVEEPAVDRTGRVPEYEADDAYRDFIRKSQIQDAVIVKELSLLTTETRRVLVLIRRGIIRDVLNEGSQRRESDYKFDERRGLLTLTAPSEQIAMIETMVRDHRTFVAVTELNRSGNSAAVIPVASPFYLEQDFRGAVQLATDNLNALRRLLQDRDWRYAYRDKECWLNAEYGTVTVVDDDKGIESAQALMERRPFVPRELVHE